MNWSVWIRQFHRWLSIAFTLAVAVNFIAVSRKAETFWIGLLALVPLFLLLFSGLYMFALPYVGSWRAAKSAHLAIPLPGREG